MTRTKSILIKILIILGVLILVCGGVFAYTVLTTKNDTLKEVKDGKVYYPLTGEEVTLTTDETLALGDTPSKEMIYEAKLKKINKRPISVKIVNDYIARPQDGLNEADVVYETMIEGGESRFNAVFQSNIPDRIGPVRSARYSDTYIVPWVSSILFYSGSNSEVAGQLKDFNLDFFYQGKGGSLFQRISERVSPYNLYLYPGKNASDLYKKAKEYSYKTNVNPDKIKLFFQSLKTYYQNTNKAFKEILNTTPDAINCSYEKLSANAVGADKTKFYFATATSINVNFSGVSRCNWKYDTKTALYYRWQEEKEHMDAYSATQVNTKNVVVMFADYPEAEKKDPAGNPTYKTILTGEGDALVLRDGYIIKAKWEASNSYKPVLKDANGVTIPLAAGRTYYQIIANHWGGYKVNTP